MKQFSLENIRFEEGVLNSKKNKSATACGTFARRMYFIWIIAIIWGKIGRE